MTYNEKWMNAFVDYKQFKIENGNGNIPKHLYGENSGINIFEWIQKQKYYYRHGMLSIERVELLDSLGNEWRKEVYLKMDKEKKEDEIYPIYYWERGFKFTREYYHKFGTLPNPNYIYYDEKSEKNYFLGKWVLIQMMRYNGDRKKLSKEKQKLFSIFM